MSIGFFIEENAAVVWRGAMLHKAIQQFLEDVEWGELDYLLLDLPPGTGDVSMTLAQLLPQSKFVIVTTPQPRPRRSPSAAPRCRKGQLEVIGVIENMSRLHHPDGERFTIFGEGGGQDSPTSSTSRCSARRRFRCRCASRRTRACRSSSDPDDPAAQAISQAARGMIAIFPRRAADIPGSPRSAGAGAGTPAAGAGAGRHDASRWPRRHTGKQAFAPSPSRPGRTPGEVARNGAADTRGDAPTLSPSRP